MALLADIKAFNNGEGVEDQNLGLPGHAYIYAATTREGEEEGVGSVWRAQATLLHIGLTFVDVTLVAL